MTEKILVTGGAGYIGSHACVALLQAGFQVVVVDNLCNSHPLALERVQAIAGKSLVFEKLDIRDGDALDGLFAKHAITAVMHFAGLKAVGESCQKPLFYYENNVVGTIQLLQSMQRAGVRKLIFSSSATVYGFPDIMPIKETTPLAAYNPYGRTKQMIEEMLGDLCLPGMVESWQIALLRYFNPA
ncbi:MAG TPA: SDR family NAD(P)-dependent oxidoreductase, partial [Pseudomonadales bacterium]|nr:SDR family NAD(P)-dependent oxidoreductase [Pseudomonadales bacterium]